MSEQKEKWFDVEFTFSMRCGTRGYAIKAVDEDEALEKAKQCIDKHGQFDFEKYKELGGDEGRGLLSWDTHDGTDHAYEIDGTDVTIRDGQDEDEDGEEESEEDEAIGC